MGSWGGIPRQGAGAGCRGKVPELDALMRCQDRLLRWDWHSGMGTGWHTRIGTGGHARMGQDGTLGWGPDDTLRKGQDGILGWRRMPRLDGDRMANWDGAGWHSGVG